MPNKKIIIASSTLGAIILLSMIGSIWLLKKQNNPTAKEPAQAQTAPQPEVVGVDALSPEEMIRLVLQMWYQRDWNGLYGLLDSEHTNQETLAAFTARMQELPVLSGANISNFRRTGDTTNATITFTLHAETSKGRRDNDFIFEFRKNELGWKITTLPDLYK